MKNLSIDERLSKNRFETDDNNPHIVIDREACKTCEHKACTYCCPAVRYKWDAATETMAFDHVGCLECGNCRFICEKLNKRVSGYSWNYPLLGAGVVFREG